MRPRPPPSARSRLASPTTCDHRHRRGRDRLIELRDEEPEGDRLGVRIEILSDEGADFTYDLSFQIVTKSDITDIVRTTTG